MIGAQEKIESCLLSIESCALTPGVPQAARHGRPAGRPAETPGLADLSSDSQPPRPLLVCCWSKRRAVPNGVSTRQRFISGRRVPSICGRRCVQHVETIHRLRWPSRARPPCHTCLHAYIPNRVARAGHGGHGGHGGLGRAGRTAAHVGRVSPAGSPRLQSSPL